MIDFMNATAPTPSEPFLRTLSPALRDLERQVRSWQGMPHRYPMSILQKAALEGLAGDLVRQADALQQDMPLLVVVLMGGTGVGKSTLLNALAGGAIAQASFARPTTRDPVVYYHESIQNTRLDPALRLCKLVAHSRPALQQKILVDTPDIDSTELGNRDKLMEIIPVADIVLYVGSQEKYHDQLGWKLFLEQRWRRAFAFVLNKWDRCQFPGAGTRPDEDLLRDLKEQGFKNPLLFQTCAQYWVDHPDLATDAAAPPPLPGERFHDLVHWLEMGLTQLEVEAIKARGVTQMLHHLQQSLEAVRPPDLTQQAERTRSAWRRPLADEAKANAAVLLNTLEPYQREVEHFFALERQGLFRGLMAGWLHMFHRLKYLGSTLRDHVPFVPRFGPRVETTATWDLSAFTLACSRAAADQHLDSRIRALTDRLLVEADGQEFPVILLSEPMDEAGKLDWSARNAQSMIEVLGQIETVWKKPRGLKRIVQGTLVFLANWVPALMLAVMLVNLIGVLAFGDTWFVHTGLSGWSLFFSPLLVPLMVIVCFHLLIAFVLPLRWSAIRTELEKHLETRLFSELEKAWCQVPLDVVEVMHKERRQVDELLGQVNEVAAWVDRTEQKSSIQELYGKDEG